MIDKHISALSERVAMELKIPKPRISLRQERVISCLLNYSAAFKTLAMEEESRYFQALSENLCAAISNGSGKKSVLWNSLGDVKDISAMSVIEGARVAMLVYNQHMNRELYSNLEVILQDERKVS